MRPACPAEPYWQLAWAKASRGSFTVHCVYSQPVLRLCSMSLVVAAVSEAGNWVVVVALVVLVLVAVQQKLN